MNFKRGTTRVAFLIGKYAIKIPRFWHTSNGHRWKIFLRGILANIDEDYWWKYSKQKDKLCPIIVKGPLGLFLIMKRAKELTEDEYNNINLLDFSGLPLDAKLVNFGKINDKILLVDYADSRYMCSECSFNFKNR